MRDDPRNYRLTIEDYDPGGVDDLDRLPDVHFAPAAAGHFWVDEAGDRLYGYYPGALCGGCGWRPDVSGPRD